MSLKERVYSVLIVSSTATFNSTMASLLPESTYYPIHTVSSINAAKKAIANKTYDFVLINSPLPDDSGVQFAIDTSNSKQTVVLLLIKAEIPNGTHDKVAEHGVFTLTKPTAKATMLQGLNWMISARERLRQFEKKTLSIEKKMVEIQTINRAKCLLISELKMSEADAHRYIEKRAMDACVSKKNIAEDIIKTYT